MMINATELYESWEVFYSSQNIFVFHYMSVNLALLYYTQRLRKSMMIDDNFFVVISGNIGAGKTTLCSFIREETEWQVLEERVSDYLYVKDFYEDMHRWSFHSQLQFIVKKFEQQKMLPRVVFQDRSAYECYEIFSRKLFDDGFMNKRDFICLSDIYNLISSFSPIPSLIVHLKSTPEVEFSRIMERSREFEKDISFSYIMDLEKRYELWTNSVTFCPLLEIDTSSKSPEEVFQEFYKAVHGIFQNI